MKKVVIFLTVNILMSPCLSAQNVGIGEISPSAKLTVAGFETTVNGQAAAIKIHNKSSTNTWLLRAGASGTTTPNNGFSIGDNADYRFVINSSGNVGIGLINPTARLHVNGGIQINGTNVIELGTGLTKEASAGKIGYGTFTANTLDIVGGGTTLNTRAIRFWNEGGATFEGRIHVATGKITANATGAVNLIPIAMGSIAANGAILSGSGNFYINYFGAGLGTYIIYLNSGESYSPATHVFSATINQSSPAFIYAYESGDAGAHGIVVKTLNTNGLNQIDKAFSFVLYKTL